MSSHQSVKSQIVLKMVVMVQSEIMKNTRAPLIGNNKMKAKKIVTSQNKEQKINLIAQEIKFAKILAGNNLITSGNQINKLKKWFEIRSKSSFRKLSNIARFIYMYCTAHTLHFLMGCNN